MTEKEALWRLKDHFRVHDDGRPTPYLDEAVQIAYKALEYRIPKIIYAPAYKYAKCPTCGAVLSIHHGDGYFEHLEYLTVCTNPECCQKLQWQRC